MVARSHRAAVDPTVLRPFGYKILLEILGTHPHLAVAEVSFEFAERGSGESKAGAREAIRYGRHLLDLRRRVRAGARATEPGAGSEGARRGDLVSSLEP